MISLRKANMTTEHYKRIKDFMKLAKQKTPDKPTGLSDAEALLRARLILEEAFETVRDLGFDVKSIDSSLPLDKSNIKVEKARDFNMVGVIDGCCDISVVTIGTLIAMGVPDDPFLRLVDENNLQKFGPGHSIREDGKIIKPIGFKGPDIEGLLKSIKE